MIEIEPHGLAKTAGRQLDAGILESASTVPQNAHAGSGHHAQVGKAIVVVIAGRHIDHFFELEIDAPGRLAEVHGRAGP